MTHAKYKQLLEDAEAEDRLNTAEREKQDFMADHGLVDGRNDKVTIELESKDDLKAVKKVSKKFEELNEEI